VGVVVPSTSPRHPQSASSEINMQALKTLLNLSAKFIEIPALADAEMAGL
jgi:hypothetical protein